MSGRYLGLMERRDNESLDTVIGEGIQPFLVCLVSRQPTGNRPGLVQWGWSNKVHRGRRLIGLPVGVVQVGDHR